MHAGRRESRAQRIEARLQLVGPRIERPGFARQAGVRIDGGRHVEVVRAARELRFAGAQQVDRVAVFAESLVQAGQFHGRIVAPGIQFAGACEGAHGIRRAVAAGGGESQQEMSLRVVRGRAEQRPRAGFHLRPRFRLCCATSGRAQPLARLDGPGSLRRGVRHPGRIPALSKRARSGSSCFS